jgi:hypothetical protein
VFDSLDPSDDVGPAELSDTVVELLVGRVHVRTKNSLVPITQDFSEDLRPPRCGYMEEGNRRSYEYPKPAALSLSFPSGLIDVENRLFRQSLPRLCMGTSQGFGDLLMKLAHRSETDVDPEDRLGDFLTTPPSDSVQPREMGQKRRKPGAETGPSHVRDFAPILCPTGASDAMKLVFGDLRFGLWNIHDLMAPILAGRLIGTRFLGQDFTTIIARFRKHRDHAVDFFDRYQIPVGSLVTRLAASLTLLGFHRTPCFGLGRRSIR